MTRTFGKQLSAFAIAAVVACGTIAGSYVQSSEQDRVCAESTAQPLAVPSFAHPMPEEQLKTCDVAALYYGFDRPPDPQAALQCAYYQRAHPDPTAADPFSGPGVLSMVYANGAGVKRNYDLAIRFACEIQWAAQAETEYRIGHLQHLRDAHAPTSDFDLCDDATSGLMQGACENINQRFEDAKRQKAIEAIKAKWPNEIRERFPALHSEEKEFEDARINNEVDLSGTGRAAFALAERGRLRNQFIINLKRFADGDIPAVSATTIQAVDRRLNRVYQRIQQAPASNWQFGTIKPSGIRDTERVWIKLRDAWVEFGRRAYPSLDVNRLTVQLTRLRIHQLESLLQDQ